MPRTKRNDDSEVSGLWHHGAQVGAKAKGWSQPYELEMTATLNGGRYELSELRIRRRHDGPEVTGEGIRRIPVRRLLARMLTLYAAEVSPNPPKGVPIGQDPELDRLHSIAYTYKAAHLIGEPPTKAVAESFNMPRSTAARWIAKARERGILGPARVGQGGEATAPGTPSMRKGKR